MPVVMLLAVAAVLVAVFFVATGRGGELSSEHVDYAPLDLGSASAADIAMVRPPTAMWGYNVDVTDEALDQIARAVRDRDLEIAYLREQLAGREMTSAATSPGSVATGPLAQSSAAPSPVALPALPEPSVMPGPADEDPDQEQGW
ncbi:MAG TPA: hypothetical protein VIX15_02070 [Streptosporangiaceae bacterium]